MVIEIDFQSDEALYIQLMNQIIMGIATSRLQEGDPLPSVRQLVDKIRAMEELKQNLKVALARGCCNNVTREEVHSLIDEILDEYRQ